MALRGFCYARSGADVRNALERRAGSAAERSAENFGIDYFDVEDFKQYVELNKCNTKL